MEISAEQKIAAPRDRVYAALNDPEILRQSIPGCETLEKVSDTEMKATVVLKVGPVKARFKGAVSLQDLDPPVSYSIIGEGKGGPAGFAKGRADIALAEDGAGTILSYVVKVDLGGKIAQLGSRLMDSTARKISGQFFDQFSKLVEEDGEKGSDDEIVSQASDAAATGDDGKSTDRTWRMIAVVAVVAAVAYLFVKLT